MTDLEIATDDPTEPVEVETAGDDVLAYDHTDDVRKFRERGDERVMIRTDGRQIRPWLAAVRANMGREGIVRFEEDSINVRRTDPAHVFVTDVTLNTDALREYDAPVEEHKLGVPLNSLSSALTGARLGKSKKDPVEFSIGDRKVLTTTTREYDGGVRVPTTDTISTVDPDSVRSEPSTFEDSLTLTHEADIPPGAFIDVVEHFSRRDVDYFHVKERNGKLAFEAIADETDDISVEFASSRQISREAEPGDSSLLSFDYVRDAAQALKAAKATGLTVRWGSEFPVVFAFERTTNDTTLFEGHYGQAPRIMSD